MDNIRSLATLDGRRGQTVVSFIFISRRIYNTHIYDISPSRNVMSIYFCLLINWQPLAPISHILCALKKCCVPRQLPYFCGNYATATYLFCMRYASYIIYTHDISECCKCNLKAHFFFEMTDRKRAELWDANLPEKLQKSLLVKCNRIAWSTTTWRIWK